MQDQDDRPLLLLVDDIRPNLDLLAAHLGKNYRIRTALDGREALLAAREEPPDLVILDIIMPEMDGYEVCRKLKEDQGTRDIPVIFATSMNEETNETEGLGLGAVDYVVKPYRLPIIMARVENHLELARVRKELQHQNDILAENVRLREDFERISRHDLKTPLQAVIGFSSLLLQESKLDEDGRRLIRIIQDAGYKMLRMVNISLDLHKMESGTYMLLRRSVDLIRILESIGQELSELSRILETRLAFTLNGRPVREGDQALVQGDETLLFCMLSNLVRNGMEAVRPGETVTTDISMEKGRPDIRVFNPGTVPEEIRDTFFDKYATAGKAGGNGLGTYSAMLVARAHGGTIALNTSEKDGTTVTVCLPGQEVETAGKMPEETTTASALLPSLDVLLADDSDTDRMLAQTLLKDSPLRLTLAEDGRDAVTMFLDKPYHLVLLDMEMPCMGGMDAAEAIRKLERANGWSPCAIALFTANPTTENLPEGPDLAAILTKPVKKEDLFSLIRRVAGD